MWYFGKHGFSHKSSGVPGFLFDASTNGLGGLELLSGSDWKAAVYSAYEQKTKEPQPNYRLPESNVRFDARKDFARSSDTNWTSADFNDADWKPAKVLGKVPMSPWNNLYERPIPLWKDHGIKNYGNESAIPAVSDGKPIACKLPYNAQITPILKIDAAEGLEIDIRTDNYRGGGENNVRAEYVTKNGVQEYESLGWMNGHTVVYTIPAGVKILSLQYRETGYDTEIAGSFECDDPFYNELWKKAARTLYVSMRDVYFDCPDRERAQWWAPNDVAIAFYAFDPKSAPLPCKGLYELMYCQRADGTVFAPVPAGNWDKELPLVMLAALGRYGMGYWTETTGDNKPIKDLYPRMKRYLDLWQFGGDNLVLHRKGGWDWGDWGKNIDMRMLTNCWYYLAMETLEHAAKLSGNDADAKEIATKRQRIANHFDKVFWTGSEYRDPQYKGETDDRVNALAVVAGLADSKNYPAIREVLLKQKHASVYMEKFVLEALIMMRYEHDAFARMKERFKTMVEHPCTTLWEDWRIGAAVPGGGTTNHPWAGGGLVLLSQYAAGVTVRGNRVSIHPVPSPLTMISSKTSTPYGNILVNIERQKDSFKMTTVIPEGMTSDITIPKRYADPVKSTSNDVTIKTDNEASRCEVSAGTWSFESVRP
jgi:hypothetical protein